MRDEVLKWLNETGYPLEMRVAQAVIKNGFGAFQALHYTDSATSKSRETDVVGIVTPDARHRTELIIECKTSDVPWIAFLGAAQSFAIFSPFVRTGRIHCPSCEKWGSLLRGATWTDGPDAYAIVQKRNNSDNRQQRIDLAFESIRMVADAAVAFAVEQKQNLEVMALAPAPRGIEEDEYHHNVYQTLPIVVTTSPLFTARLNAEGNIELEQVNQVHVVVPSDFGGSQGMSIMVLNELRFGEVLTSMKEMIEANY